ncbi:hypothetical protein [Mycobacteroides abscessus]|uniref:hypothetical protein n=1 Tax=Mycobacteroides abscessus TaxID=36809 RepID=UPI0009A81E0C|nr:hypothetical protein [Mycobacteroides abscessus]MBN7314142.1 hypothetical protein [Mycobacteroides abscessus subsp. abscessus]SKG10318.1 Uncharacterised protein [Mycobacteroides abscessus subsp. massiliense]
MSGHQSTALLAGGGGLAVLVASFQTWVKWAGESGVVITLSGTGEFSSPYVVAAQEAASWHAFPIGWITAVLGVVVLGSAVLHHLEILDDDVALKAVGVPSVLGAVAAAAVLVDKNLLLTGVPEGALDGATSSVGVGTIVVLLGFLVAMSAGFALSGTSRPRYVRSSSTASSRSGPALRKDTVRPATKKATKNKTKTKSKKKKAAVTSTSSPKKVIGPDTTAAGDDDEALRAAEEALLTAPRVEHTGGSQGQPPIWLTHWAAQLPARLRATLAVPGAPDAGPVLLLHPGGGVAEEDLLSSIVRDEKPWLLDDLAYVSWQAGLGPILAEIGRRYAVLELIRDDAWLTPLMQTADIATSHTRVETVQGEHGLYQREVTIIDIPVLVSAGIQESGLILRFAERAGDSTDRWTRGLTALRDGFAAEGMNTAHLHVVDGPEGCIELRFNDTEELAVSVKE